MYKQQRSFNKNIKASVTLWFRHLRNHTQAMANDSLTISIKSSSILQTLQLEILLNKIAKKIKDTQKLHSVRTNGNEMEIEARLVPCLCLQCLSNQDGACLNKEYSERRISQRI